MGVEDPTRTSLKLLNRRPGSIREALQSSATLGFEIKMSHLLSYTHCHSSLACNGRTQGNHVFSDKMSFVRSASRTQPDRPPSLIILMSSKTQLVPKITPPQSRHSEFGKKGRPHLASANYLPKGSRSSDGDTLVAGSVDEALHCVPKTKDVECASRSPQIGSVTEPGNTHGKQTDP